MGDALSFQPNQQGLSTEGAGSVDLAIAAWLHAKANKSGSTKTRVAYETTVRDFRAVLKSSGLDLNSEPRPVALLAQGWAGQSAQGGEVSPATYNQRLAILSSFYTYALRHELAALETNPIARVERRSVQGYAGAAALDPADVRLRLKAIDRSQLIGKRDYALLAVALHTGRRLSEIAALEWRDLLVQEERLTLTFRRCKGGKTMRDRLPGVVSRSLLDYLAAVYETPLDRLPAEAPIWVRLSRNVSLFDASTALSTQAIADVCLKRLGTSKVHTLRHTFARMMEDDGAKVSDIQARLGHESLATTGRYLAALKRADNPHADGIAARLLDDTPILASKPAIQEQHKPIK